MMTSDDDVKGVSEWVVCLGVGICVKDKMKKSKRDIIMVMLMFVIKIDTFHC